VVGLVRCRQSSSPEGTVFGKLAPKNLVLQLRAVLAHTLAIQRRNNFASVQPVRTAEAVDDLTAGVDAQGAVDRRA
jgi:hypothetical protein